MKRTLEQGILVTLVWMLLTLCGSSYQAQTLQSDILSEKLNLHISNCTLLLALSTLAVDKRIPIGFEPGLLGSNTHTFTLNADNAALKYVLDTIVKEFPDYEWQETNQVINITPVRSRDEFVEKLLKTRISRFEPARRIGKFALRDAILNLPEVQHLLRVNGIAPSHSAYFYRGSASEVDLSISDTDLRMLLNKVIRESEHKMWVVVRTGNNLDTVDVGF